MADGSRRLDALTIPLPLDLQRGAGPEPGIGGDAMICAHRSTMDARRGALELAEPVGWQRRSGGVVETKRIDASSRGRVGTCIR